jgi:hypothetical protein
MGRPRAGVEIAMRANAKREQRMMKDVLVFEWRREVEHHNEADEDEVGTSVGASLYTSPIPQFVDDEASC